jgi:NADH-quinone oxidoreductase subunit E
MNGNEPQKNSEAANLTADEIREIDDAIPRYTQKRSVGPEALRIVQRRSGWVSDENLRDVAAYLDMSPEELESLATFYDKIFREPVGRHIILVCDSVSCWIMGADTIIGHLKLRLGAGLGETTSDGRFTILPCACLGLCDRSPAMMIDDDVHGNLDGAKIDRILEIYP